MNERKSHPDHLEELMAELQRAEDAGVFRPTPVDPAGLASQVPDRSRPRLVLRLFVALQAAACIALLIGVVKLWPDSADSQRLAGGNSSDARGGLADTAAYHDTGALAHCITGPDGNGLGNSCVSVDFDADGDVDLADFGALQRTYASDR